MATAKDLVVLVQPVSAQLGAEGLVVGDFTEGEHKISNEVRESIRAGLKDFGYGETEEEVTFTATHARGDKGQKAFLDAIKKKEQLKFWIVDKQLNADGTTHNATFGYSVVEEYSYSFDDEEGTVEVTLKVKFNTAEGTLPKLPDSILNPSSAVEVKFEKPGERTGTLETNQLTAEPTV